jgi:hypothetical protein
MVHPAQDLQIRADTVVRNNFPQKSEKLPFEAAAIDSGSGERERIGRVAKPFNLIYSKISRNFG